MANSIRILLADDHSIIREGLAALISRRSDMDLVGEACDGREAVELYRQFEPDVVLMDLQMPVMGGIEAIYTIHSEYPDARIIVLTSYADDEDICRSMHAGAVGYLMKDVSRVELWDAIRYVGGGYSRVASIPRPDIFDASMKRN